MNDKYYNYFQDCFFYLHKVNENAQKYNMTISLGKGFHCSIFLPIVTHVVCEQYSERDEVNFYKYGKRVHIVHPEFLNQSMLCRKKLVEKDYNPKKIVERLSNRLS